MAVRNKPAAETSVKRTIYTIRWDKRLKCWVTKVGGFITEVWDGGNNKVDAVSGTARQCEYLWDNHGILSELRICNKAGKYQPARTYGNDPSSPG